MDRRACHRLYFTEKSRRLELCGLVGLAADDSKLHPRVTYFSHTRGRKRLNIFITIKQGNPKSLKFNYWLSKVTNAPLKTRCDPTVHLPCLRHLGYSRYAQYQPEFQNRANLQRSLGVWANFGLVPSEAWPHRYLLRAMSWGPLGFGYEQGAPGSGDMYGFRV